MMPFPEVARVRYEKCPLVEVVCQLRFPAILSINSESPAAFQDEIRDKYPIYESLIEKQQQFEFSANENGIQSMSSQLGEKLNHTFISEDGYWKVNLTDSFISLSTRKYEVWEDFKSRLEVVVSSFLKVYRPPFFGRLGLRYIDVYSKSKLGLDSVPWRDMFKPEVLGMLAADVMSEDSTRRLVQQSELALDDGESALQMAVSLGTLDNDPEHVLVIDSDAYFDRRSPADLQCIQKLDYLHSNATSFIRWAVSDLLHNAMMPSEIEG